jgi:general secretion pathway protein E
MILMDGTSDRSHAFLDFLRQRQMLADTPSGEHGSRIEAGGLEKLWRDGAVAAGDLANAAAEFYGLPRSTYASVSLHPPMLQDLSRRFLREAFAFPFDNNGVPELAIAAPEGAEQIQAVRLALGRPVSLVILSFEEIELLFERAGVEKPASNDTATSASLQQPGSNFDFAEDVDALQDLARGAPIVRTMDQLLERALETGATDIHLETGRENLRVRFRVDGHLRQEQALPKNLAPAMISRVKILAGLDIAERRLPQDGRTNVLVGSTEADLRVAIMPTLYGETAVLRILLKDTRLLEFGRIGLSVRDRQAVDALLAEPHGIVIVTGPTGSGKTTTLATAISVLNDPARKIVTVEDPIEYQLPGIHQTQIKPAIGLTFATALRSFLRHDPDVIMVGEMRDRETAAIGIQAALTGHLVLTTLHTNTAADAVVRLADMGIEPYLIASSLRGVLGQRLVRRLCERCRRPEPRLLKMAQEICIERGFTAPIMPEFHVPVGCAACGQTGYRGRVGVFEVLRVDDRLQSLVRREPDPQKMLDVAREGGMTTMLEDGLAKAARGLTSIDEVVRATG